MKTTITYQNKSFIEEDNTKIKLIKARCSCGNKLIIPLACAVLGIVKDCAHCGKDFPAKNHSQSIISSYKGLIEGEELVEL